VHSFDREPALQLRPDLSHVCLPLPSSVSFASSSGFQLQRDAPFFNLPLVDPIVDDTAYAGTNLATVTHLVSFFFTAFVSFAFSFGSDERMN
jgi:hypothetical protein